MHRRHISQLLPILLPAVHYCSSWQAVLINNENGTQIWSPFLHPHGFAKVNFGLPSFEGGRAARLSDGKAYFVGGLENTHGITYIFDPATNTTVPGARLNMPLCNNGKCPP